MATFSLNEIESTGKRAGRGAGLHWGLAEDAGKAARWLAAHDLPGPEALAGVLTDNDGQPYEALAPQSVDDGVDNIWRAPKGRLCPLISGAALSDRAAEVAAGRIIRFGPVTCPLLLAPYAAGVCRITDMTVTLCWLDAEMAFSANGVSVKGSEAAITAQAADSATCQCIEAAVSGVLPKISTRAVDTEVWACLNAFATRTFAPATEASRLAGAGAGLVDND